MTITTTKALLLFVFVLLLSSSRGQEVELELLNNSNNENSTTMNPANSAVTNNTNCPLVGFLPFTKKGGSPYKSFQLPTLTSNATTIPPPPPYAVTHAAAALVAMDHFNARDNRLIPELDQYTANCSVQLNDLSLANTDTSEGTIPKYLLNHVREGKDACAVLGGYASIPTREAAVVANGMGNTVVVSHGAEAATLTLPSTPEVTRTCSNQHPMGEAIVNWLVHRAGRTNYWGILHTSHSHGVGYSETLDNARQESSPSVSHALFTSVGPPFTGMEPNHSIRYSMLAIQKSTYRTIIVVLDYYNDQLPILADVAEELQMNTDEYVWVFVLPMEQSLDEFVVYSMTAGDDDSDSTNLTNLVQGAAVIRALDVATMEESAFYKEAWQIQDASFVRRLNAILPKNPNKEEEDFSIGDDYFQQYRPEHGAGYMYDAVMAVGMGKCQEEKAAAAATTAKNAVVDSSSATRRRREERVKGSRRQERRQLQKKKKKKEVLSPHMQGITSLEFTGVTGKFLFNERRPRNRQRQLMTWGVYNIRTITDQEQKERMGHRFPLLHNITHWYYLTDILEGGPVNGEWTITKDGPFLFADGTVTPPKLLRDVPEQNYLSSSVRITGLTLMSISLLCSVVLTLLVLRYRERSIIKGNQPLFLYVLLVGTFVMALSILFLSFDESTLGLSPADTMSNEDEPPFLDIACTCFPWFLSLGYVMMYGALFMKLWRINLVLQCARPRSKVDVHHVLWPCVTLLAISMVVLTTWTAVDPWQWERQPIDSSDPQGESYGQCTSEHQWVYIPLLAAILLIATVLTGWMAWKTKDVDAKFSESSWIFTTIVLQFQVLVVGAPILVIVQQQSADATYMGQALLIWTITMSAMIILFGPKLLPIFFPKMMDTTNNRGGADRSSLARGSVRVSGVCIGEYPVSSGARNSISIPNRYSTANPSSAGDTGPMSVSNNTRTPGGAALPIDDMTTGRTSPIPDIIDGKQSTENTTAEAITTTTTTTDVATIIATDTNNNASINNEQDASSSSTISE